MRSGCIAAACALAWAACERATPDAEPAAEVAPAAQVAPREDRAAVDAAVRRAGDWMAAFPDEHLRFDGAIGLHAIREHVTGDGLDRAYASARAYADRDDDNPLRRLYDPAHRAPADSTSAWTAPAPGERRINVNRVLAEAAHCAEHGLRDQTLDYLSGAMRDDGGYQTAHALWALVVARDCIEPARYTAIRDTLAAELRDAQPEPTALATTGDLDLFAERLLMLELAGIDGGDIDAWRAALLARQNPDGSWGGGDGASPEMQFHATLTAAWALAH